jgi:hypothetical protein
MNSASLYSLAGRYDIPIPPRFLSRTDCSKIPALAGHSPPAKLGRTPSALYDTVMSAPFNDINAFLLYRGSKWLRRTYVMYKIITGNTVMD